MDTPLQDIYDGFAETYEQDRGRSDMTEVLTAFYSGLKVKQGGLLDLGCGAGEPFARWFVDRGWSVTGVDFSQRMLELAAVYVPEMERVEGDIRHVDFAPRRFDAITAVYSLFHLPSGEHEAMFAKLYDWLRPGGKVLFTYATEEYTGSPEFDGHKVFMGQDMYYSHTNPDTLYLMLKAIGFRIESTEYREIGGEVFLWVTVSRPEDRAAGRSLGR